MILAQAATSTELRAAHAACGVRLTGAAQIGFGTFLFCSLACMVVGAVLVVAADRPFTVRGWKVCFAFGMLGFAATMASLAVLDANPERHVPCPLR